MSEPEAPTRLYDRAYGLARSLAIYHGRPGRGDRLDRFYARFMRPGSLCFDIGAHVGDRSRCWSRLGARVVALEPQPDLARFLRLLFRRDPCVLVLAEAVGAASGRLTLHVSPRTPTVTSGSPRFLADTARVPGFAWVAWSQRIEVPMLTIYQFSRHSQSFGSGRARSISLTAVRRPRVNQDSLLLASFLG